MGPEVLKMGARRAENGGQSAENGAENGSINAGIGSRFLVFSAPFPPPPRGLQAPCSHGPFSGGHALSSPWPRPHFPEATPPSPEHAAFLLRPRPPRPRSPAHHVRGRSRALPKRSRSGTEQRRSGAEPSRVESSRGHAPSSAKPRPPRARAEPSAPEASASGAEASASRAEAGSSRAERSRADPNAAEPPRSGHGAALKTPPSPPTPMAGPRG